MAPPLERMTHRDGALLVIDAQDKLLALIEDGPLVVANAVRLVRAARELAIPHWATEQYPRGLGPTAAALSELIPHRPAKTMFHCCAVPEIVEQLHGRKIRHVTLAGIETHVCVAQTALELLGMGFRVQVPADAVASRSRMDWEFALRRLEHAGAVVSTTEAVLFEWVECSDSPHFKAISALVKDFVPPGVPSKDPRRADPAPSY
jgi:nicotinamidase-related amidase